MTKSHRWEEGRDAKREGTLTLQTSRMSRVRQAAVSWQFLQHVHEFGEGRSLLFKGPAEEKNVLKGTNVVT